MSARLKRLWHFFRAYGFDVATGLALVGFLAYFGGKLSLGTTANGSGGPSGAKSTLTVLTTPEQLSTATCNAVATKGAIIGLGLPATIEYNSIEWRYSSERLAFENLLVQQLTKLEDCLSTRKPAAPPSILVPSVQKLYDLEVRNGANSESAYPGAYAAKLQSLRNKIDLHQVNLFEGTVIVTPSIIVTPFPGRYSAEAVEPYINFYYPNVVDKALAEFKKSDPNYLAMMQELKDAQKEYSRDGYVPSYALPRLPSDETLLEEFSLQTTDSYLRSLLVPDVITDFQNKKQLTSSTP